jgi:hypothetical protein
LDQIDEEDLRRLVEDQVAEGKSIDYKQALPGKADQERREFLHDVSSFANASGGHLVYGVAEEGGFAKEICGVQGINPDRELTRLEEMVRGGLRPRIFGVQFRAIPLEDDRWVLIVKIPKSWNPPHQVTFQSDMRFSARGATGKYLMDVDELRSTLEVSDSIGEKARNFRLARIAKLAAGESHSKATEGGFLVVHFLPLAAFTGRLNLSFPKIDGNWPFGPPPFNGSGFSQNYCFDGFVFTSGHPETKDYRLYFRNGAMEYVDFYEKRDDPKDPYRMQLPSAYVEKAVRKCLEHALNTAKQLELDMPAFVSLSLLGMRGWTWSVGDRYFSTSTPFDSDPILVTEQLIESLDADLDKVLKLLVDPLWHAAGWEQSPNFINGTWTTKP